MIKSILLAVDGSIYTDSVIDAGIDLSKRLNAFIRVLSVVDVRIYEWVLNTGGEGYMPVIPSSVYHDESHKFLNERADSLLLNIEKKLKSNNVSFECFKIDGSPVEVICEYAARQADMLIMGERGDYARWADRFLGASLESVSRQCISPIMIVGKSFSSYKSIICAYDRSEHSTRALKLAAYFTGTLSLPLEVITIHSDDKERKATLEEAKNYLRPYNLSSQFRHEAGDPTEIIIQSTKDAPDPSLLIMGSYGHSRIREAILGSTTVQVMRDAIKPILLSR